MFFAFPANPDCVQMTQSSWEKGLPFYLWATWVPHLRQNFSPGSRGLPQPEQKRGVGYGDASGCEAAVGCGYGKDPSRHGLTVSDVLRPLQRRRIHAHGNSFRRGSHFGTYVQAGSIATSLTAAFCRAVRRFAKCRPGQSRQAPFCIFAKHAKIGDGCVPLHYSRKCKDGKRRCILHAVRL